jgi:signal transduction histidine kinase
MVAAAEALVRPQLDAKGLRFAVEPCPADAVVRVDADKTRQVLLNLLGNAVKFTERGGEVRVRCETAGEGAGAPVLVRVIDTGRGIPHDKLGAIFEPFVQVNAGLTRVHDGAGLGLAISRDLARGMGGELTVESAPGAGSTFTLSLPAGASCSRREPAAL